MQKVESLEYPIAFTANFSACVVRITDVDRLRPGDEGYLFSHKL